MSDVSLLVLVMLDRGLRQTGRTLDEMLDGMDVTGEQIRGSRRGRMPWSDYVPIMERIAEALGGPEAVEEFGTHWLEDPPGLLAALASRYAKPHSMYYIGLRWLLEGSEGALDLTARRVARRLGMSERTLARGLSGEGTTFTRLRDEVRRDIAIDWLERGVRIENVSAHVGFSDVSSFHRAFRRWTDRSPGSYSPAD